MADRLHLIRERAEDPRTRTDRATLIEARAFLPATREQIEAAEVSLDFSLPAFLCRVYTAIGNGGFGPGRGLIGVPGGATDEHGNSIVDLYDSYAASNPDDDAWRWPDRLVPICHWGESVYSCADCSDSEGAVVCFDLTEYEPGRDLKDLMVPQHPSIERWLEAWAEGIDLWREMYPLDLG
jgi:hypothetical protein